MSKPSKPERTPQQIAIDYLSRREHSRRELAEKLSRKGCSPEDIDRVIDQLVTAGLQSDRRFVEASVQSRVLRGIGPLRVRHELKRLVDDEQLIEQALEELAIDWYEIARNAYHKKYSKCINMDYKEKVRRMRFLQARGFPGDIIHRLIS